MASCGNSEVGWNRLAYWIVSYFKSPGGVTTFKKRVNNPPTISSSPRRAVNECLNSFSKVYHSATRYAQCLPLRTIVNSPFGDSWFGWRGLEFICLIRNVCFTENE